MINKNLNFRSVFSILLIVAFAQQTAAAHTEKTAWDGAPVGECFESKDALMYRIYGNLYKNDENIIMRPVPKPIGTSLSVDYVWAMDVTPARNWSRFLFRVNKANKQACVILFMPAASVVNFKLQPSGELPATAKSRDVPPPHFNPIEVLYKLNSQKQIYAPSVCYSISWEKESKRTKIDCKNVYK
jgi:hypothetical protein